MLKFLVNIVLLLIFSLPAIYIIIAFLSMILRSRVLIFVLRILTPVLLMIVFAVMVFQGKILFMFFSIFLSIILMLIPSVAFILILYALISIGVYIVLLQLFTIQIENIQNFNLLIILAVSVAFTIMLYTKVVDDIFKNNPWLLRPRERTVYEPLFFASPLRFSTWLIVFADIYEDEKNKCIDYFVKNKGISKKESEKLCREKYIVKPKIILSIDPFYFILPHGLRNIVWDHIISIMPNKYKEIFIKLRELSREPVPLDRLRALLVHPPTQVSAPGKLKLFKKLIHYLLVLDYAPLYVSVFEKLRLPVFNIEES